jgi:hypothetical protein
MKTCPLPHPLKRNLLRKKKKRLLMENLNDKRLQVLKH